MFERIKERLWRKPEPPPPPKEPEPEIPKALSQTELLANTLLPLATPREAILIELTKSKRPMTPKLFILTHWPYTKVSSTLMDTAMLQRTAMIPYRALRAGCTYRMLKIPLQAGWVFHLGTHAYPEPPTEPAEMFMYIDDPDWELVDVVTHQLTPKGSLLVKQICLATMSSVMDYHVVNGIAFLRLKPPAVNAVYDTISEAASSILGKK